MFKSCCALATEAIKGGVCGSKKIAQSFYQNYSPVLVALHPPSFQMDQVVNLLIFDSSVKTNKNFHITLAILSKSDWKKKRKCIESMIYETAIEHLSGNSRFTVNKVVKMGRFVALAGDPESNSEIFLLNREIELALYNCGVSVYKHTSPQYFNPHISIFPRNYKSEHESDLLQHMGEALEQIPLSIEKVTINDGTGKETLVLDFSHS